MIDLFMQGPGKKKIAEEDEGTPWSFFSLAREELAR